MRVARPLGSYTYQRHQPEHTVLFKVVQQNLETFLSLAQAECGRPLPDFVEKEFREYLKCGVLAHGFMRSKCEGCHNEHLVAFSCKRRGFCPSCGGRRMSESAIHLVDEVLPVHPVRQWVLSFPIQIRVLLSIRPKIMTEVLNIATKVISTSLCKKAGFANREAKTGAVTLIQRFGGSLNLNVHFHQIFLDGAYELDEQKRPITFHITKAPTRMELAQLLDKIIRRTTRLLEKRGLIVKDEQDHLQINLEEDDALSRLQANAAVYRFAMGPNKGKKAITLKSVDYDHSSKMGLVAENSGFSLHAGVAIPGCEREKIEKLCRYIARPAVALERLSLNQRGDVVYTLKRAYDDGTTAIQMTPLEFMERLASIVPRPRMHLTRFSGVFAPHYKHRAMVVPKVKTPIATQDERVNTANQSSRITWARLLKRVFGIDFENCQLCGKKTKPIAAIEDPHVIKKILAHLGLPTAAPVAWPARGPPQIDDQQQHFDFV